MTGYLKVRTATAPKDFPAIHSPSSPPQPSTFNMCWHKWIPVTPQGCKALNPHIMMHKETIYCNTVIDTAIKLSQPNYFLDEDEREQRRDNTRFRLQACPHEDSKIVDSFNRRIEVKPLQVVNPRCPCCTGEMSMVDALMVRSRVPRIAKYWKGS
jgi:hypothetical protein